MILENIFLTVINMSITASIAALIVILLRQLSERKLSRNFIYAAWVIVLIRLLVPISIKSDFSIFNIMKLPVITTEKTSETAGSVSQGAVDTGDKDNENYNGIINENVDEENNTYINNNMANSNHGADKYADEDGRSVKSEPVFVMSCIWLSVCLILLALCIYAYIKLTIKFRTAVLFNDNGLLAEALRKLKLKRKVKIYVSDRTDTPVVSGIANVRIIIPAFLADDRCGKELEYVITHELVHIKRYDNITRLLAVLSLCIHWFNPLMWLCFALYQKDMEISCDAGVLAAYDYDIRTEYANSLLNVAVKQNNLLYGVVLAFGESSIKSRMKEIMRFKKNKVRFGVITVLFLAVFAFILLTNGQNDNSVKNRNTVINNETLNSLLEHRSRYIGDASNVSNLLEKLPYGKYKEGIELYTVSEPYGITVNYMLDNNNESDEDTDALEKAKPVLLDNALILFSLIENVETVKFNILPSDKVVQFERTQLQQYFDRDLWEYSGSREDFEKFLLDINFKIFVFPEKYSLAISSLPGMQISIGLNAEYYDAAYRIKYSTENGSLLTKDLNDRRIIDHGKSLEFTLAQTETVYWAPYNMDDTVSEIIVTISVLNKNGDIIISKRIRVDREDEHIYTVKPSYDISYDYVIQDTDWHYEE